MEKNIGMLANKLDISLVSLEHAIKKIHNLLEIKGKSKKDIKISCEVNKICTKFSELYPISDALENLICDQYQSTSDLVSLPTIIEEYDLPDQQLYKFVRKEKSNTLIDYLGYNIFLNDKQKYIARRKIKGFLKEFFIFLLSHYASTSGYVLNKNLNIYEEFFAPEEVQVGNSRKGRILGFYKNKDHQQEAIVGFYNGEISFQKQLKKFSINSISLNFKATQSSQRPIIFSFSLDELLSKDHRFYINMLIESRRNHPFKILYGGGVRRLPND